MANAVVASSSREDLRSLLRTWAESAEQGVPSLPHARLRRIWEEAASAGCLVGAESIGVDARRHSLVVAEELGRNWLLDLPLWMQSDVVASAVRRYGVADQHVLLSGFACGSAVVAVALSEAGSASSLTGLSSTARAVDGGYLLDAEKRFVSNAVIADHFLVSAAVGTQQARTGLFLVSRNAPGLQVAATSMGRGLELLGTGTVSLTGVHVPSGALLGGTAMAAFQLGPVLSVERLFLALMSCSAAWSVVSDIHSRGQAARPAGTLLSHSSVEHQVAELVSRLTTVTSLVRVLSSGYATHGTVPADQAAIGKFEAVKVLTAALNVLGGLSGAAGLVEGHGGRRSDLESRRRAAAAQGLAGGAPHALHSITIAGLTGRGGRVQIV
ncbi:acyl-CoA dehydrogenase family protein [Streptomyces sp. NBC_01537]|uniref:acyl-CoA dehydrogenase family protein n=1 Tax=Streptomyces sp. NBC_01537 TaxID=2903896 RepID=UPI0038690A72